MNYNFRYFLLAVLISFSVFSQENESAKNWDNQIYIGNKVATAHGNWRYSGEIQVRLENNMGQLDRWYGEFVATYLISEKFEIVPDFRITRKPEEIEYRPGIGVIYKFIKSDFQFVNQLKWQGDYGVDRPETGFRYAVFVNRKISDKIITNFALGAFYRIRDNWNGVQFVRFGPGVSYIFNKQHTINLNYFLSVENNSEYWMWSGIPSIQLIININKNYKYVPAKYISF